MSTVPSEAAHIVNDTPCYENDGMLHMHVQSLAYIQCRSATAPAALGRLGTSSSSSSESTPRDRPQFEFAIPYLQRQRASCIGANEAASGKGQEESLFWAQPNGHKLNLQVMQLSLNEIVPRPADDLPQATRVVRSAYLRCLLCVV